MNIAVIERATKIIARCQRAQEWLQRLRREAYRQDGGGRSDSVKIALYSGNLESDTGYSEAIEMMEAYAKISFPALVKTAPKTAKTRSSSTAIKSAMNWTNDRSPQKTRSPPSPSLPTMPAVRSVQYTNWAREAELQGRREQARRLGADEAGTEAR